MESISSSVSNPPQFIYLFTSSFFFSAYFVCFLFGFLENKPPINYLDSFEILIFLSAGKICAKLFKMCIDKNDEDLEPTIIPSAPVQDDKKKPYVKYVLITLSSLLEFLAYAIFIFYSIDKPSSLQYEMLFKFFDVLSIFLFSKILLKEKFLCAQIIYLILIGLLNLAVFLLIFFSFNCINNKDLVILLSGLFFSLSTVIDKKVMKTYKMKTYDLLYTKGIFEISSSVFFVFLYWCLYTGFKGLKLVGEKKLSYVYFIGILICSIIYNILFTLSNFYYTPGHVIISKTFSSLLNWNILLILQYTSLKGTSEYIFPKVFASEGFILLLVSSVNIFLSFILIIFYTGFIVCPCHRQGENPEKISEKGNDDQKESIMLQFQDNINVKNSYDQNKLSLN